MFPSTGNRQNQTIQSYRSKDLSVLALFNLNRNDSVHILSILEDIDHDYTHQVDIKQFITKYCPDYYDTFMFIFEKFYSLLDNSTNQQSKVYEIPMQKHNDDDDNDDDDGGHDNNSDDDGNRISLPNQDNNSINNQNNNDNHMSIDNIDDDDNNNNVNRDDNIDDDDNNDDQIKKDNQINSIDNDFFSNKVPYHYFFCFLLTLQCIPDAQIILWLHWLSFSSQNIVPSMQILENMIEQLWGKLATTKQYEQIYTFNKTKAQNLTVILDPMELTPSKIRIFDINTKGIWTTPILLLRKQIRSSSKGYYFWNRVNPIMFAAISNIEESYERLKEPYR